ncbi:hypothetical protein [Falsiroseomonas ponticola]|uniref:hypothetical protein n=1 Tax=Falsiroseomonas ponticola TaxID=2786951 RepID=UPI0019313318|nr:hypothetical protein [Roseomonas ponticola]
MLVTLAGTLIAILPVLVAYAIWRLLRAAWRLLRAPRLRLGVLLARAGRLRPPPRQALRAGEEELAAEVARLRSELRLARAELALAEAARRRSGFRLPWRRPGDDRFQQAKIAFARAFHPDRLAEDAADRAIRAAIFRDFWEVLRRIEKGADVSADRRA